MIDFACVGDSIVRWIDIDSINPGSHNKLVCRPGATIADIRNSLKEMEEDYTVKNLLVHVGCNEIPQVQPFEVARRLSSLLAEIKVYMPFTKVFVSGILPKLGPEFLPGINDVNFMLFNTCQMLGMSFIQHSAFCRRGEINFRLLAGDGIHLNRGGIKQFELEIKELVPSFC